MLLSVSVVARRSQIAADMLPRRASHPAKIPRKPLFRLYETPSRAKNGKIFGPVSFSRGFTTGKFGDKSGCDGGARVDLIVWTLGTNMERLNQ